MIVNGAGALVVVVVARLVTPQSYGAIAQLLGLFFILSMPGSAVLVGVVRRVTALQNAGHGRLVQPVGGARSSASCSRPSPSRWCVVLALQGWIARQLSLPEQRRAWSSSWWRRASGSCCRVDRGLLQAHRSYRALAGNLLVEGVSARLRHRAGVAPTSGVAGYALGVFISEVVATVHARWLATRAWSDPARRRCSRPAATTRGRFAVWSGAG